MRVHLVTAPTTKEHTAFRIDERSTEQRVIARARRILQRSSLRSHSSRAFPAGEQGVACEQGAVRTVIQDIHARPDVGIRGVAPAVIARPAMLLCRPCPLVLRPRRLVAHCRPAASAFGNLPARRGQTAAPRRPCGASRSAVAP